MTTSDARHPLIVLGMHRSGTSALAAVLNLCGAWIGAKDELTPATPENHKGYFERRDVRRICDTLLHSANADWWRVAGFHPSALPHTVVHEQQRNFRAIVSALNARTTWAIKEPRLCLLLPVLLNQLHNPICIHIVRNPLEVARSLKARNGFPILWGLALWEAYSVNALLASSSLPRVFTSYRDLVAAPCTAIGKLVQELTDLGVSTLTAPPYDRVDRFLDPTLRHQVASDEETRGCLTHFQRILWQALDAGDTSSLPETLQLTADARSHLLDLESAQLSLLHARNQSQSYKRALQGRDDALSHRARHIGRLNSALQDARARCSNLETKHAELETKHAELETKHAEALGQMAMEMEALSSRLRDRDKRIDAMTKSLSWRLTRPLRLATRAARKHLPTLVRATRPSPKRAPVDSSPTPPPALRTSKSCDPDATFVVPLAWWHSHPETHHLLLDSRQPLILWATSTSSLPPNITCVVGEDARALAFATVVTPLAIEVTMQATLAMLTWESVPQATEICVQQDTLPVSLIRIPIAGAKSTQPISSDSSELPQ